MDADDRIRQLALWSGPVAAGGAPPYLAGPMSPTDPSSRGLFPSSARARLFWAVFALAAGVRLAHLLLLRDAPFFPLYMGDAASYHLWALELAGGAWIGDRVFYQAPGYPYFLGVVYALIGNHPMVFRVVQALLGSAACGMVALAGARLFSTRAGAVAGGLLALYAPAAFFDGLLQKASLAFFLLAALVWLVAVAVDRETRGVGEDRTATGGEDPAASDRDAEASRAAGGGQEPTDGAEPPPSGRFGADPLDTRRTWAAAGAVLGLLVLTRENALILLLPLLLWILLGRRRVDGGSAVPEPAAVRGRTGRPALRARLATAGVLALGTALTLTPVAVRNHVVSGEPHLTTSQFGPNFYMGNNPRATGLPMPLRMGRDNPRFEQRDAVVLAERARGRELSPGEVSAYWTERALDYVRSRPLDWLGLMGRKLLLFWNDVEIGDTEDLYTHAEHSPVLRALSTVFRFGLLVPVAILGVWITRREAHRLWPFWLLPLVYSAGVLLFFVFARYRLPVVPFLALFAGAGLVRARRWLRSAPRKEAATGTGVVLAAGLLCFWPAVPVDQLRSGTRASIGAALERRSDLDGAVEQYRRALELEPDNATAHFYLATALQRQDQLEPALERYRRALELEPERPEAHNNYGVALVAAGRREAAREHFRQAAELDPFFADPRDNLGTMARSRGEVEAALDWYRQAVEADARHPTPRLHLADLLVTRGRIDEAFRHYREAARLGARREVLDHVVPVAWRMATVPEAEGRNPERALALARGAVELAHPPGARELRALAAAQAAAGRHDEAVRTAERALEAARRQAEVDAPAVSDARGEGRTPAADTAVEPAPDTAALQRELELYRDGRTLEISVERADVPPALRTVD
jgi:Flp pilus assembly protein TadD